MNAKALAVMGVLLAGSVLAGCEAQTPGTTRFLGDVGYEDAFAAARSVMGQYYPLADASVDTGVIVAQPTPVDAAPERLLGGSPARHAATLRLRREEEGVYAVTAVRVQRAARFTRSHMPEPEENYSGVPQGVSLEEAASTPEQNENWITDGYDRDVERRILEDLFRTLNPQAPPAPAPADAPE